MPSPSRCLGALAVSLALVACAPPSTTPPDAGAPDAGEVPDTLTPEEFSVAAQTAACKALACALGVSPAHAQDTCFANGGETDAVVAGLKAGRLVFDEAKATACVEAADAFDPASCWGADADGSSAAAIMDACGHAATGTVAVGGSCFIDVECADGWCDLGTACPGTCATKKPAGRACEADAECATGLECATGHCIDVREAGESCAAATPCREGLSCTNGTCTKLSTGSGGACASSDECADGLFCQRTDPFAESGTCAPKSAAGEPCTEAGFFFFIESPQCEGRQVCVNITYDDEGAPVAGTCATPSDVGEPCVANPNVPPFMATSGCYFGLLCDATSSKCVLAPKAGEACLAGQCAQSAYCDGETCREKKVDGSDCELPDECQGWCDDETMKCTGGASPAQCLPE